MNGQGPTLNAGPCLLSLYVGKAQELADEAQEFREEAKGRFRGSRPRPLGLSWGFRVRGLGFAECSQCRIQDLGFGFSLGSRFKVRGLGFAVCGSGFRVWRLGFAV